MNIKNVSESFFVSDTISTDDLSAIKALGIKTIICNRPDEEQPEQASFNEIQESALKLGISCVYWPTSPKDMDYSITEKINEAMDTADGPILAYCRSGLRSISLWSFGQIVKGQTPDVLCQQASTAGYDIQANLTGFQEARNR